MQGPIRPDLARPDQRPVLLASACQETRSGQHCYGDNHVDLERSRQVYGQWTELTRPAPGPNKPTAEMFVLAEDERKRY